MRYTLKLWADDMGQFSCPGCRGWEDATQEVNSARDHDGLRPVSVEWVKRHATLAPEPDET